MGVWGTGPFENDEAQDLAGEVEARGLRSLRQPLRAITSAPAEETIDEDLASRGVAAAVMVARALGLETGKLPSELQEVLESGQLKCTAADVQLAGEALERILTNSFLEQAWSPADRKIWRKAVSQLRAGLKGLTDKPPKAAPAKKKAPPRKRAAKSQAGDVLLIPISDEEYAVAKVLYAFRQQKHCLLIAATDTITRTLAMPPSISEKTLVRLYTADAAINEGVWHKVGEVPLSEEEQKASLRLIADEVWFGDEMLRVATAQDKAAIPDMMVNGDIGAEYDIQLALGRVRPGLVEEQGRLFHLRARVYLKRKEYQTALIFLNLALQYDKQLAGGYWDRAHTWEHLGKPKQAASDRQQALAIDPSLAASSGP